MKKYFLTSAAALAFCGLFTSCTHDFESLSPEESVAATYEKAFIKAFGQPAPDQTWGFGSSTVAATRGGTRVVPGITFPDDFSEKTDITEPDENEFGMPSISKNNATAVTGTDNVWASINAGSTVYLEENAVLRLYNEWSPDGSITLQNVNLYMSKGSRLEVPSGLYISGTTNLVNNEGFIVIGSENNKKNIAFDNLRGKFWNNGSITGIQDMSTSNDGGTFYFGSKTSFTASNISLNKVVKFWNEGEITLTGKFEAKEYGHKIYNSGTIITPKIILPKETVLWNEGTITAANSKEIDLSVSNNDVQIYNGTNATLKLETLTFNNNQQLVVNEGTLNVKGKITIPNNSEIVNYNTLTGGSFEMLSGAKFYNVAGGEVTIDGLSKITNDGKGDNKDNVWRNGGIYTTGSFEATGGCQNPAAFNNCHMYVTNKFFMNHSNFVLDGGAAVECGSFEWLDDNYFHMGGKALLKVTGELLANNNDTGYGFYGDDPTDYAVIQAGSIEKGSKGKFRAAYFGNLFIDTDSHFTQGENNADGTWYTFGDNVKFSFTDNTDVSGYQTQGAKTAKKDPNFSITIPADPNGCTPGYNESSSEWVRVVAEDLTASAGNDFDFNDVVFDVSLNKDKTYAYIILHAAGGTLPLYIGEDDKAIEVHGVFKQNTNMMINTGGSYKNYANCVDGLAQEGFSVPNPLYGQDGYDNVRLVAKAIKVVVIKNVGGTSTPCELKAEPGQPTAKLCVGTDYQYSEGGKTYPCLTERTPITEHFIYNSDVNSDYKGRDKFSLYVKGIFGDDWYQETAQPKPNAQPN